MPRPEGSASSLLRKVVRVELLYLLRFALPHESCVADLIVPTEGLDHVILCPRGEGLTRLPHVRGNEAIGRANGPKANARGSAHWLREQKPLMLTTHTVGTREIELGRVGHGVSFCRSKV